MQRAEAWRAEANVKREGMGVPEAALGASTVEEWNNDGQKSDARPIEHRMRSV